MSIVARVYQMFQLKRGKQSVIKFKRGLKNYVESFENKDSYTTFQFIAHMGLSCALTTPNVGGAK